MIPQDEYLESKVLTASPHQLHLLVIDAAIRHATVAVDALTAKDFETMHNELCHARDHVSELMGGLNEAEAPELVLQLKALFTFCYRCLAEAEIHHQTELIEDAMTVLRQHRETWIELIDVLAADSTTTTEPTSSESHSLPAPHFGHARDSVSATNVDANGIDATYETGSHEWSM